MVIGLYYTVEEPRGLEKKALLPKNGRSACAEPERERRGKARESQGFRRDNERSALDR